MGNEYAWVNPSSIVDESPVKAVRKAFSRTFSPPGLPGLDPEKEMPVLLGFALLFTRPHPTDEDAVLWSPTVLVRVPGSIELVAPQLLRSDSIVDVHHAVVKGKAHALWAVSDSLLNDDFAKNGHTLLRLPPNPIGWALEKAAGRVGAICRHWKAKGGTRVWRNILEETAVAESMLGLSAGSVARMVEGAASWTPSEVVEVADLWAELGLVGEEE